MSAALASTLATAIDALTRFEHLLEREHAALQGLRSEEIASLAAEKQQQLATLSRLLPALTSNALPTTEATALAERLEHCRERNRSHGLLMNLQLAQRASANLPELGLQSRAYGPKGYAPLQAGTRRIAAA